MAKIHLRKVHYCTNLNFNTNRIENPVRFHTGYIVTRLIGSGDFYIPKTYNGLNIVGITWNAYENMSDYMSGSSTYAYYDVYPNLHIHPETLIFIMLPKRYSNASRVYPIYSVDRLNGYYDYRLAGMTYNQNQNILSYLLERIGCPYNAGYATDGDVVIEKVQYGRRYTATPSIGMWSSPREVADRKYCFNYFEYPYFTWSEIRDVLANNRTGLAYCRVSFQNASSPNEVVAFAYNYINGYDVDIDASKSSF